MKTKKIDLNLPGSSKNVIPAKAGIQKVLKSLDFRWSLPRTSIRAGNDELRMIRGFFFLWIVPFFLSITSLYGHSIHYDVQQKGISLKVFYEKENPASYSEYELFGPGDKEPHQIGRTDKNGFLSFLPDRAGIWKAKVWGESTHGFHGVTIDVKIDQSFQLESFSKPLVATYTKLIVGISLILGLFGIYALWKSKRKTTS